MDENVPFSSPTPPLGPEAPQPVAPPTTSPKHTQWLFPLVAVLVVVAAGMWYGYQNLQRNRYAYTIPNVPLIVMYTTRSLESRANINSGVATSLAAVLRYWGDTVVLDYATVQTFSSMFPTTGSPDVKEFEQYFTSRGYVVETINAANLQDLEPYINSQKRIPLVFNQKVSTSTPYYMMSVLLGIDVSTGTLITTNFYYGQLYKIPFSALKTASSSTATFYAIYPADPTRIVATVATTTIPYPPRTSAMDTIAPLIPIYIAFGHAEVASTSGGLLLASARALTLSPLFSYFHPAIQTYVWSEQARAEIENKEYTAAFADLQKALTLDQNLNQPFPGWKIFTFPQIPAPYYVLASYYRATGDKAKAAAAQKMAQNIASSTPRGY